MAGTATAATKSTSGRSAAHTAQVVTLTSTAGGAVSANPVTVLGDRLVAVKIVPAAGGTQPSDLFDLTLLDEDGIDMLAGAGANQSNAAGAILTFDPPKYLTDATLDVVLANAGSAKVVTVTLVTQRNP